MDFQKLKTKPPNPPFMIFSRKGRKSGWEREDVVCGSKAIFKDGVGVRMRILSAATHAAAPKKVARCCERKVSAL